MWASHQTAAMQYLTYVLLASSAIPDFFFPAILRLNSSAFYMNIGNLIINIVQFLLIQWALFPLIKMTVSPAGATVSQQPMSWVHRDRI